MQNVCIVGVGNVGGALALAMDRAGWRIRQLVVRNDRVARKIRRLIDEQVQISQIGTLGNILAEIVIIAVDDPEIQNAAATLSAFASRRHVIFHTSGSRPSSVLAELKKNGAAIGSIHPLASISDPIAGAGQFAGAYFCVEGDRRAVSVGRKIVETLGGKSLSIDPSKKALYHAAAVMAAGHVTSLFDCAVQMMSCAGVRAKDAKTALFPLMQSTLLNLNNQTPDASLTGTFARLDLETFRTHLASFDGLPERLIHLYLELGERSLDLVERRDGPSPRLEEFRRAVSIAKQKCRC